MQSGFSPVRAEPAAQDDSFFFGSALQVERTIWYLRWAALGGGAILAWVAGLVATPGLLLGMAVATGLINLLLDRDLRVRQRLPTWWGYGSALIDVVLLSGFVLSLEGPANRYAHLYLPVVATAAMRFGFRGTLVLAFVAWSGLMSVFLLTYGLPDDLRSQLFYPSLLLLLAGLLLGQFAHQVKSWLRGGQQREHRLAQRLTELAVIQEVNNAVYDLKSDDTLQSIVQVCTKVLDFRRAALFLSQKQEGMPDRYYSFRPRKGSEAEEELSPLHFDHRLFEAMLKADRPFVVDGSQGMEMMAARPLLELAVALRTPSGPIGVLVVDCDDRKSVSETDVEVLSALANSATLAIENAQIHKMVQWRADHDGLTSLYNHGFFQQALRQHVEKSQQQSQPLALLMIEVDSFKNFNDTYGHRQGDTVLTTMARALEFCAEKWQGVVARYGGDEFVMILPGREKIEAQTVAGDVVTWVRHSVSESLVQQGLPPVTISAGLAVLPHDAQDAGLLLEAADQAMYAAKRRGGDRLEICERNKADSSAVRNNLPGKNQGT